jgi:hypothetical protein
MDWTAVAWGLVLLTLCCAGKLAALLFAARGQARQGIQPDLEGQGTDDAPTVAAGESRCRWC